MKSKFQRNPIVIRLIALWRVLTCRNLILIDFKEIDKGEEPGRNVRVLYRSDYGFESEILTLQAAIIYTEQIQEEYENTSVSNTK